MTIPKQKQHLDVRKDNCVCEEQICGTMIACLLVTMGSSSQPRQSSMNDE